MLDWSFALPDRAPRLLDQPPDIRNFRGVSADEAAKNARTSAAQARTGRMSSAISQAQKLWVADSAPFALSGLADPEPWADAVAIVELLDGLNVQIARYLHVSDHSAHALALWIVHTWVVEWAPSSPRLAIVSPPIATGKTTALRLIGALTPRPLALAPTPMSILLRTIDLVHPTVLIDDAQNWALRDRRMRTMLAAGHAPDAVHLNPKVHAFETVARSCFTPCAFTLTGHLHPELAKRSITVKLAPALAHERREPLTPGLLPTVFGDLRARAVRWARDHGRETLNCEPQCPAGLFGSPFQNWRPLLAIAQSADVEWVQRTHTAAVALTRAHCEVALDVELLADVRAALGAADRMTSDALLKCLLGDAERPWRRSENGRSLDARTLANRLRPYGARPRVIRTEPDGFARGYMATELADAFDRYLPPQETSTACVHS